MDPYTGPYLILFPREAMSLPELSAQSFVPGFLRENERDETEVIRTRIRTRILRENDRDEASQMDTDPCVEPYADSRP